ncbi:MAG: hypothetical protein WD231_03175 [Candidatus Woykebacteria bacterium]
MAQGINLLPQIAEDEAKKEVYKRKLNVSSIGALLGVSAILVGIFSYQLFLQTTRSRVEKESQRLEGEIVAQKEKEISQRALVDKLNQIQKTLDEEVPVSSAVANISNLAEESGAVKIENIDVNSDGDVSIGGVANNSASLSKLIKAIISERYTPKFNKVILSNLSNENKSSYKFVIDMTFIPRGLVAKDETF